MVAIGRLCRLVLGGSGGSQGSAPEPRPHPPMANPVLIEVTRGKLVESSHRGALVVADAGGRKVLALGDVTVPVFPRSAVKLIQALPLVESGAADRFGYGNAEIALACGSHVGSERHVAIARSMVERLGLTETCLACGAAMPMGEKAAQALAAGGGVPTAFHHQCSGKHAGMLAAAKAMGASVDPRAYAEEDHPVQRDVKRALETLSGGKIGEEMCGLDGCSVPTWAIPLERLARLFAVVATGHGASGTRNEALSRILAACWAEPELVAGPGRAETVVMAALPGQIYMKSGAEGVYCGALPGLGLGFALKIDDGAQRACAATVMPLIEQLLPAAQGLVQRSVLRATTGAVAGTIRAAAGFQNALDTLKG